MINQSDYNRDFANLNNSIKALKSKLEEKEKIIQNLEEKYS